MKTNKHLLTALGAVFALATATLSADMQRPPARSSRAHAYISVPAGTFLTVRLTQTIDTDYALVGSTYNSVLDDPVMMGGSTVIPRGARVGLQAIGVKQAGRLKGADKITLRAYSVSFGGRTYDIASTYVQEKSKGQGHRTAKKVGIGAGIGAVVGGLFGGGAGAAVGAAVGGTTGVAVAGHQSSQHLLIPAESRLQFQLTDAVTVRH